MTEQTGLHVDVKTKIEDAEAVALCVFTDEPRLPDAGKLGEALRKACERALSEGEFKGEAETSLILRAKVGDALRKVLLAGAGTHEGFDAHALMRASSAAVRAARSSRIKSLQFALPQSSIDEELRMARALAEGAHLGLYENDFYQERDDEEEPPPLERLTIVASREGEEIVAEVERARIVAESVNWARRLSDEPGLSLTPREFARRAAEMAEEFGLKVESLRADEARALGMGAFLGVAQGSEEEPVMIVLRYEPEGASAEDELWAFVGKGITFDTGGISLKRGPGMEEMKADMAGGAAVLGALRAIAQMRPNRRIVSIVPATENMISGSAVKPGDVVRALDGKTIEVVDTDAEGRLVLSDALAYARRLGATRIIDLATLTGSIIIALGTHRTGLFSNDDEWAELIRAASMRACEPLWRMPVSDDYKKLIESDIADFKNYGGRPDATGAALLLSKFAEGAKWAHMDIAGTSWLEVATAYAPKGATGAGLRTLVELACEGAC